MYIYYTYTQIYDMYIHIQYAYIHSRHTNDTHTNTPERHLQRVTVHGLANFAATVFFRGLTNIVILGGFG